ncbi:MAG: hypothetical protein WKF74_00665 [Pyrinomonadaceae bacterium]
MRWNEKSGRRFVLQFAADEADETGDLSRCELLLIRGYSVAAVGEKRDGE